MKRTTMLILTLVGSLLLIGSVYAHGPWGSGMGYRMGSGESVNLENVKNFQKETLSMRDELITKRIELRNEYNKPQRDYDRIGTLRKEIVDIQTKIQAIADKYGVPTEGYGMGHGMMGKRMTGQGCPCPMAR